MDTTFRDWAKLWVGTHIEGEASLLVIVEEGVPWYYDIMKFLELGEYQDGADKKVLFY